MAMASFQSSRVLSGHEGPTYCCAFEGTGTYVLTGGHDKSIKLFNTQTGSLVSTFSGHAWEVYDLSIASHGTTFLSGGGDRSLFLWDVASQRIVRKFAGHHQRINAVTWGAHDHSVACSASYDRSVRLWDVKSAGRFPLMILEEAQDSVTSVQVFDKLIITGSVDGYVRCYDIRRGRLTTDNIQVPVTNVCCTKDGLVYMVSSLDSTIRLIDYQSGALLNQ